MKQFDAAIIGGGVIGCCIAYNLAIRGKSVAVIEKDTVGTHASSAAAGMLGAQVEMAEPGPLTELGLLSRDLFPPLIHQLYEETGINIEWNTAGILKVAMTEQEKEELQRQAEWQRAMNQNISWLDAEEARKLEPALSPEIAGALTVPDDTQISAPHFTKALAAAAAQRGVVFYEKCQVESLLREGNRVYGVKVDRPVQQGGLDSAEIRAGEVIIAAGSWTGNLVERLGFSLPVSPTKGECFTVLTLPSPIKKTIYTHECYIVPKAGGRLLVGATMKQQGFDNRVTVDGLRYLTEKAIQLLPCLASESLEKSWASLRPTTPDGLPYIGRLPGYQGLIVAAGHFRNGILLSPITGELVSQLILDEELSYPLDAFSPGRVLQEGIILSSIE